MSITEQIVNLLKRFPTQCSFANIVTKTNPCRTSQKSKNLLCQLFPNHTDIVKMGSRNVSIGNTWTTAINNRIEKSGAIDGIEYVPEQRTWAERITNGLIAHKENGQMYVEYYYLSANESSYEYRWEDGSLLTKEELEIAKRELFKPISAPKKQMEHGLDKEDTIKINIVKIENVVSLHAFGEQIEA